MRTLLKFGREDFLTLRTRAAGRLICFEFPKERWVERVSLLLLSGREMLSDKATREGVCWLRPPTWQGEPVGFYCGIRGERIIRGMGKEN